MKRAIISSFALVAFSSVQAQAQWVVTDPGLTAAVNTQTIKQITEMVKSVQLLQSQVADTQNLLQLAKKASEGLDGVDFISDFRNTIMKTNEVIETVKDYVDTGKDVADQWKDVFGSLDKWVDNANEVFGRIDMSDKVNSSGFLIADSYQKLYEQNSQTAQKFIENSKNVNEKGALKQIAQELAQLIQMENHVIFLLSQMLKGQSIENSNENLERKEEVIKFNQENQGVRRFMGMVDDKTFEM